MAQPNGTPPNPPGPLQLDRFSQELQQTIKLYKQIAQQKASNKGNPNISSAPLKSDCSLNITLVDGYIRLNTSNAVPSDIIKLIRTFYPRSHIVYGAGWNHYGELSVGNNSKTTKFQRLINFEAICDDAFDIYAGWKRFIIRNCYNDIYCVGRNIDNDLGIEFSSKPNEIHIFKKIEPLINEKCYKIYSGQFAFHTFLLSSNNNLYAFGQNTYSQCGYINGMTQVSAKPVSLGNCNALFNNQSINKICCGDNFSLFLTKNGNIFSCGSNKYGSCGFKIDNTINNTSAKQYIYVPTRIQLENDVKIVDINCGGRHVLCLSKLNNIWVFGHNLFHQLGLENPIDDDKNSNDDDDDDDNKEWNAGFPRINHFFDDKVIDKLICGFSHNLILTNNRNGYLFGRNHKGQCGKYHTEAFNVFETVCSPLLFKYNLIETVKIRDGNCGYEHTILITTDNELISFGGNTSNQCLTNDDRSIIPPSYMDKGQIGIDADILIERVICGIDTTVIVCC